MRAVAKRAIALLHYDPDTLDDEGKAEFATEDCAQACYDCLLSYANQWDHQQLDRHGVIPLLADLATSSLAVGGGDETRAERLVRLTKESNGLEQRFLTFLDDYGYRLPDQAQEIVDGYFVRPDFAYRTNGMDVAIFIDGPVHDSAHQAQRDEAARAKLEDEAGWIVLRFRYDDPHWRDLAARNPSVFGAGRVTE